MKLYTETTQVGGRWTLEVSHEACTSRTHFDDEVVVLDEDPTEPPNTLSRIVVKDGTVDTSIHVYWQADEYCRDRLSALAVGRTSRLFVGAGRYLAIVGVAGRKVVLEDRVELFWNLASVRDCVLARSELQCLLFAQTGKQLGAVPVDPPWEEVETDEGIVFTSPVCGRQVLRWPSVGADC